MKLNNYSFTSRAHKLLNSLNSRLHKFNSLVNPCVEVFSQLDQLKIKVTNYLATQLATQKATYSKKLDRVAKVIHRLADSLTIKKEEGAAPVINENNLIKLEKYSDSELRLLRLIYSDCVFRCSLTSSSLKTSLVADSLGIKAQSLRNLIASVIQKNDMSVQNIQKGRGYFRVFEMSRELYQSLTEDSFHSVKFNSNLSANGDFNDNSKGNCNGNSSGYSSSYIYKIKKKEENNISTQKHRARASLYGKKFKVKIPDDSPDQFSDIDIKPLASIGFTKKHVKQIQIFQTAEELQESINHFAWALEHGKARKKYGDPLNVFIGVMRKGNMWIEKNYETEEQIRSKLLQTETENSKKIMQQQESAKENLVNEFVKKDFAVWESNLKPEEKEKLIPATILAMPFKAAAVDFLKRFYRDVILPERISRGELQYAM